MSNNIVDKPTNPWDDNKYWTYPGSNDKSEGFRFVRSGNEVFLEWIEHSFKRCGERANFLNKLVADGWKFTSVFSDIVDDNTTVDKLTIVVAR
jgi:hypothetical protein